MATNIIQTDGSYELKYTTTGAVTSGSLLVIGKAVGVALEAATGSGQEITVLVGGSATLTKLAAASSNITVGGWVSYTATGGVNKVRGSAATADNLIGVGLAAATTAATSAQVRLIRDPMVRIGDAMAWAAISAAVNAAVADHCGETATLRTALGSVTVDAVIVSEPTGIAETGAWETIPTAMIPEDQITDTPRAGDLLIDAAGTRWLVDRATLLDGMWSLTLRADPKT